MKKYEIHITLKRVPLAQCSHLVSLLGQDWRVGDLVLMDDSFDADGKLAVKTLCNAKEASFGKAQTKMGSAANVLLDTGYIILRLKIEQIISDSNDGDYPELVSPC